MAMTNTERIQSNNAELLEAIEVAENLPDAGGDMQKSVYDTTGMETDIFLYAESLVESAKQAILNAAYPIGSIYLCFNNTDPSTLFGGTWERMVDTFLWACNENDIIGDTGGEYAHTLTESEIPSHNHPTFKRDPNAESYPAYQDMVDAFGTGETVYGFSPNMSTQTTRKQMRTGTAGEGEAHNNMPPYTNICAWRRTA